MYLNTLLNGLKILPEKPMDLRNKGNKLLENIGSKNFFNELKKKIKHVFIK